MKNDWKREQEMTVQLMKDLKTKDEQSEKLVAQNKTQLTTIMNLNNQLVSKKAEIRCLKEAEIRQQQKKDTNEAKSVS